MKAVFLSLCWLLAVGSLHAAPPTVDELLEPAKAKAAAEGKAIYIHFGASWCGWCKKHDAFLDRADIKPVFEKYFIPIKLDVQERDEKADLQNPGAELLLTKLGGPAGLPYSVLLDAKGAMIISSKRVTDKGGAGENIGHPSTPEEITWFLSMLKKAAPKIAPEDLRTIETALRAPKK